jgi:hypothetical protein
MSTPNPYAPPQADVLDLPQHEAAPPLWNPNAAASWSLLFSPIFGAWLHMKNWQAMGETEKAATSKTWLVTITVFLILLVLISVVLPESKGVDALARFGGFGLLVAWYYQIGKSQNAFVLARYGHRAAGLDRLLPRGGGDRRDRRHRLGPRLTGRQPGRTRLPVSLPGAPPWPRQEERIETDTPTPPLVHPRPAGRLRAAGPVVH